MLSRVVKNIIARSKKNGGLVTPADLSELERGANLAFDGAFHTLTVPMAAITWEAATVLPSLTTTTGRIDMAFNRPVEIVGFFPHVVTVGAGAGRDATLFDIACRLDVDRQSFRTNSKNETTHENFVVLASLDSRIRNHGLRIDSPSPSFGVTFRWRVTPGTCKDALVGLTTFVRWLDDRGATE